MLFSTRARAVAARGNWHLWVNTYAIVNKAGHLFMQAARGDMGPNPPPATLMSSRRAFIKGKNAKKRHGNASSELP